MTNKFELKLNLVDFWTKEIYFAKITIENNKIAAIEKLGVINPDFYYIMPGFTDAHVHIESSLLIPSQFAQLAIIHGTISTISDPHEIANVCGINGVKYMIEDGKTVPLKFYFGAPSCVPATIFETAGAELNAATVDEILSWDDINYLSEMMNYPGVLFDDEEIKKKISSAKYYNKPIDGHAPALRGKDAEKYFSAGITTDHECFTYDESLEKIKLGVKILIREGSAAKNFDALIDLLNDYPNQIMFCSDDKHPDSLLLGHINQLCERAVAKGIDIFKVIQAACINAVEHYKTNVGLLRVGDIADFIVVDNLLNFNVFETYVNGTLVAQNGKPLFKSQHNNIVLNQWFEYKITEKDIEIPHLNKTSTLAIVALDGQIVTEKKIVEPIIGINNFEINIEKDLLKMVVVNRYSKAKVAACFITNFGLKTGAIAGSVAHDSHNIVAVGTSDEAIVSAVNSIMKLNGGLCVVENKETIHSLSLPIAGLMSNKNANEVAYQYENLEIEAKNLGSDLQSPFMTLSFMALLVIPKLKLSDKGLFDAESFTFIG